MSHDYRRHAGGSNERSMPWRVPLEHIYDRPNGAHHYPRDILAAPQSYPNPQPDKNGKRNGADKNNRQRHNEIVMEPMDSSFEPEPTFTRPQHSREPNKYPPAKETTRQFRTRNRVSPPRNQQRPKRSEIGVCTKYSLFAINFIVFVIGAGVTSLGAYILHLKEKRVQDVLDFLLDPSCDMCLVGSIFLLMGFIGLVGSLRENTYFLKVHYGLMLLFLMVQLSLCILVFVTYYSSDARDAIFPTDAFKDAIRKYRDDIDMQNLIDGMQRGLQCCGLSDDKDGFLDWNDNRYFECGGDNKSPESCSVPSSCCKLRDGQIPNFQCGWKVFQKTKSGDIVPNEKANLALLNKLGCVKALADWIDKHALVVGGVLLGILLPQIIQTVLTSNLIRMIAAQKLRWTR